MLISKLMILHYLISFSQSYHIEYPLASYEKRMPRLPSPKEITEFLDNFPIHRSQPISQTQKQKRDTRDAERSFFQQLNTILAQCGIWKWSTSNGSNLKIGRFSNPKNIFKSKKAVYENNTLFCHILTSIISVFIYFFAINKRWNVC